MGNSLVVWVLGAGFSRALGGPLLPDLFDRRLWSRIGSVLADAGVDEDVQKKIDELHDWFSACWTRSEFFGYQRFDDSNSPRRDLVEAVTDAEEFLERLEQLAAFENHYLGDGEPDATEAQKVAHSSLWLRVSGGAVGSVKRRGDPNGCDAYAKAARVYVAAAVNGYIPDPATIKSSERWQPYRKWAKSLANTDRRSIEHSIVTFNYDTVVEEAFFAHQSDEVKQGCRMSDFAGGLSLTANDHHKTELIKTHGSVTFALENDVRSWVSTKDVDVRKWKKYLRTPSQLLLHSPGTTKRSGSLRQAWENARARLEQASDIIFVGYRFPPSDSRACIDLLDSIGNNSARNGSPERLESIRIVLGPDIESVDVRRMSALIGHSLRAKGCRLDNSNASVVHPRSYTDRFRPPASGEPGSSLHGGRSILLIREPLFAEDFLAVYSDAMLERSY